MPIAKLTARLGMLAAVACAALVGLAVRAGSGIAGSAAIAFSAYTINTLDIYLADLSTSQVLNLTGRLKTEDFQPIWSPDGNRLAFVAYGAGKATIYTYAFNPISLRRLAHFSATTDFAGMIWSPDSQWLSLSSLGRILLLDTDAFDPCPDFPSTACAYTAINSDFSGSATDWSADGREILISNLSGAEGAYALSLDGSQARRIAPGYTSIRNAAWSPDGQQLAFASFTGSAGELIVIDRTGSRTLADRLNPRSTFAWSPDSRMLVFTAWDEGDSEVYSVDVQQGVIRQLTRNAFEDVFPAGSPDGLRIAFVSLDSSYRGSLYVMNADSSQLRRIASDVPGLDRPFSWRP